MTTDNKFAFIIDCIFYGLLMTAVYLVLKYALIYLLPFFIGFALIYILQKPAIYLSEKCKINKNILTILILILSLLLIFSALFFTVKSMFMPVVDYILNEEVIENCKTGFEKFCKTIPFDIDIALSNVFEKFSSLLLTAVKSAVLKIPQLLINTAVAVVATVFFAFYYDTFIVFIKRQLSKSAIDFIKKIKHTVNSSIFGYTKGYLIMLVITFFELLIMLSIIKTENVFVISAIIAFVDLLPVLGIGTVLVPWGTVSIILGNVKYGIYLLIIYFICAFLRYFTEPKIIGKKVGLNPLISLFAMFLGLKLFGFLGMIVLPIICAVLSVLHKNQVIKLFK